MWMTIIFFLMFFSKQTCYYYYYYKGLCTIMISIIIYIDVKMFQQISIVNVILMC